MTPNQQQTVNELVADGFQIIPTASDMILLTRGADNRFVRQDGSQKRAQVGDGSVNVNLVWGCV